MLPFRVQFEPGWSTYEQVVYAAKKSLATGQLRPGDRFPSVRALSAELKINPNTAHKVVAQLVNEGLLEVRPGIGTLVASAPEIPEAERLALVARDVERLVVEAKRLGLGRERLQAAVETTWNELSWAREAALASPREEA